MFQNFLGLLLSFVLLVGLDGVVSFFPYALQRAGINPGSFKALVIGTSSVIMCVVMSYIIYRFGIGILDKLKITYGSVLILCGFTACHTGLEAFGIDILKPFRTKEKEAEAGQLVRKIGWGTLIQVALYPVSFPLLCGPALIGWLLQNREQPIIPLVIGLGFSAVLALMIGIIAVERWLSEKRWMMVVRRSLITFGALVFVLYGVSTALTGIFEYLP